MKNVNLMVAFDKNHVIGKDLKMPWTQKADLKRLREITEGTTVIMGSNTYESLNRRPLSGRDNVIVSNSLTNAPGFTIVRREDMKNYMENKDGEMFIFGGSTIYNSLWPYADTLYITELDAEIKGEGLVYFPDIDWDKYILDSETDWIDSDEDNSYPYRYKIYKRK
ncbi:MAG: dihydrofolate reductase [Peptoniphilaceae bacterium]